MGSPPRHFRIAQFQFILQALDRSIPRSIKIRSSSQGFGYHSNHLQGLEPVTPDVSIPLIQRISLSMGSAIFGAFSRIFQE